MKLRRLLAGFLVLAVPLCAICGAESAEYPARHIRLVVPWAPGGLTDTMARVVAEHLRVSLGQTVIVENKSGASGVIGAADVANSVPDGYTFLVTPGEFLTTRPLLPEMSFDPEATIEPVALIAVSPVVLVVREDSPFRTVGDLLARARGDRITFSSPGAGSLPHLAGEWLALSGGGRFEHIAYRGGAPASLAVLSGEVMCGLMTATSALPIVQGGKARVLAVMGKTRLAAYPSWPLLDRGLGVEVDTWVGFFAPRGTPSEIIRKVAGEVRRILATDEVRTKLNKLGADPSADNLDGFLARIKGDIRRYGPVIERTKASMAVRK